MPAGGVINTGSHPKLLWPGIRGIWGRVYDSWMEEYPDLFETVKSDKAYEEYVQVSRFGLAQVKPQGSPLAYDSEFQGATTRLTNVAIAQGYAVTIEEIRDNLYERVSRTRATANAEAMRQTKEYIGANVYNRAFTAAYVGGDGVPLCSLSHPLILGGTIANMPVVSADLSEVSLEDALIGIMGMLDDRGLTVRLMPQTLHVSRYEIFNAERILHSILQSGTVNNDLNAVRSLGLIPGGAKVNHYFSSPHAWFIRSKSRPEDGMIYQTRDPIQFDQDNDFNTKNALASAYERYTFGWADFRYVWGVNGP
jgi:hypothetical protein